MGKRKRSGSWSKGDESGAKKSDDCDSQEELEGDSLIPKTNTNVRCSARVQEKQEKLRREASPSKQTIEIVCSSTCTSGTNVNIVCKGKSISSDETCVPIPDCLPCGILHDGLDGKRKKRTWELWSQYDKQLFFEALNEFGKDFDAIQTHLASKLKSKTKTVEPTQIKKKEQVRHFYYRTWNKIQKYLHFPKDMKKAFQELYGLVNYGELRKKQRALNGKTAAKLLELVEKGSTTIKVKGKTLRIKTPVCQALKKINNLTDVEPTKVPSKVVLELLPKDGGAWSVVQSLSHNPRLRSLVMLQRTLASIIMYLEERWKSSSDRIKEQMMETFGKRTRRLRLIPSFRKDSNVPIFKAYETTSSAKISLNAFSRNVLNKDTRDGCVKLIENRKRKKSGSMGGVEVATDSVAEADWSDAEMTQETKEGPGDTSYTCLATRMFRNAFGDDTLEVKGMPNDEVQRMLKSVYDLPQPEEDEFENGDADNYLDSDEYQAPSRLIPDGSGCSCNPSEEKSIEPEEVFSTSIDDDILKRGWTAEEAGSLTVGEVYMLVGQDEKLSFEYEWDEGDEDTEINARTRIMLERLITVARNLKKKKQSRHKILNCSSGTSSSACPSCGHSLSGNTQCPVTGTPTNVISSDPVVTPLTLNTAVPNIIGSARSPSSTQVNFITKNNSGTPACSGYQSTLLSSTTAATTFDPVENSNLGSSSASNGIGTNILPATVTQSIPSSQVTKESESKVKKITPTLVSSSVTGAILTSIPLKTDVDVSVSCVSSSKETKDETFRVPATSGVNGNASMSYPRIRPMPTSSSVESGADDGSTTSKNTKLAPKPFLDLPKGNRRLGRPCCKKNIVPRYLPLLPKAVDTPPQSALWDIVSNKPAVHTVYVSNAAQIMLPVANIGLKPSSVKSSSANGCEKVDEVSVAVLGSESTNGPIVPNSSLATSLAPTPASHSTIETTGASIPDSGDDQLACSSFKDLLKVSGIEQEKADSNLSLSSFMDISLPESTRNVANECLKSEKFLDVTLSSSCSLSLSNFLGSNDSNNGLQNLERSEDPPVIESLKTPKKNEMFRNQSPPSNLLTTEHQWLGTDANDLSLGSLLSNLDPAQPAAAESDMTFQSMIEDSNNHLDFTSKFSELVAELESNNTKK
ncbi:unnamed protein product [Allacma fusca]|uniref:SANT domain-containing protein n=1 Tax=Allacma fusca TaxID=39272 RepID=A0A8J2JJN1_9HEXA|nr:unnamed protein product [Allacma fusca]